MNAFDFKLGNFTQEHSILGEYAKRARAQVSIENLREHVTSAESQSAEMNRQGFEKLFSQKLKRNEENCLNRNLHTEENVYSETISP